MVAIDLHPIERDSSVRCKLRYPIVHNGDIGVGLGIAIEARLWLWCLQPKYESPLE